MMLIMITYFSVVAIWVILFGIEYVKPRALPLGRRSLAVLFFASLVVLAAWVRNNVWLSLAGSVLALVGTSLHGRILGRWFKERFSLITLLVWLLWFMTISLVFAHALYIYRAQFIV